jgi:endoglucanase
MIAVTGDSVSRGVRRPFPTTSILFTVLAVTSVAYAQSAFVRVNQVGYVSGGSKRAYLMASASESGGTFIIKNSSGTTVFGPTAIGASLGSWSGSYPDVYALDFDAVMTAGTYSVSVTAPINASSPTFKIDTGSNVYTTPLSNSLFFYQNERDGPNFIGTALRTTAAHINDESAKAYVTPAMNNNGRFSGDLTPATLNASPAVINASGGWWDAGDYLKFVQTTSYTVGMMLTGVRDFPNQMGTAGITQNALHFPDETKFGLDWLQGIGTTPIESSITKSASETETEKQSATMTSGVSRRRTIPITDVLPCIVTFAIGLCSSIQPR